MLVIAVFAILGVYYSANTQQHLMATTNQVAERQREVLARSAALAGYNVAKKELAESFGNREIIGEHEGGTYIATISVDGLRARIESTGTFADGAGNTATYTVLADYAYRHVVDGTLPAHMRYALLSHGTVRMNGNTAIEVYNGYPTVNADVHTNHDLVINAPNVNVEGFGTYVGNDNTKKGATAYFNPNYNPDGRPSAYQTPEAVDLPVFNAADMTSKVVVDRVSDNDVTLAGNYGYGGTREDPYVWHIKGNLSISGNTTLEGYMLFIVEGDIAISGTVQSVASGHTGDESSVAFYAGGSVSMLGTIDIWGQIFAGGDVTFVAGTPKFYGSISNRGASEFKGTPRLYYRVPSPALTVPWDELKLVAYSEW
ncbi:MAG: hypothetical protein KatS3mg043_0194 [Rhodothermaceae bacterium]|nr:MAG: hypothetical protein KatS3mg043_0194 [Rhodothermaceae bacterium]